MRPDITIIVPSYNNADFLPSCIGSLLSADSTEEIIVVDDGSVDDTQRVLTSLSESHSNLHVIRQANGGVSNARNAGIRAASGQYVMFVDADDSLLPGALDRVSRDMKSFDTDIVVFRSFSEGREIYRWDGYFGDCRNYAASDLMKNGYIRGSVCGCMFGLDFLNDYNIRFCEDLSMAEDTVFFACAISAGATIAFADIGLYEAVPRGTSASRSYDEGFISRYGKALHATRRLIPDRLVADNTIQTILMGIVNVAARTGYSAKQTEELCAVDRVLPLSVAVISRNKWLVSILNHSFPLFFAIKKWRDKIFSLV